LKIATIGNFRLGFQRHVRKEMKVHLVVAQMYKMRKKNSQEENARKV